MSFCPPPQQKFKALYKFCNILIPGRVEQKQFQSGREIFARLTPLVQIDSTQMCWLTLKTVKSLLNLLVFVINC